MNIKLLLLGSALASLMFTACSSDDSNTAASAVNVNTDDESTDSGKTQAPVQNASTCDLATAKLPASELAWKPTFGGGCEVSQTISLASLQKFDTLLIAAGYEQTKMSTETFRYTIESPNMATSTVDKDTLLFTYSMETFVGTFSGVTEPMSEIQKIGYELTEVARANLPAELFAMGKFDSSKDRFYAGSIPSAVNSTYVVSQLNEFGWNLTEQDSNSSYDQNYYGSITYNGNVYILWVLYYNSLYGKDFYSITIEKN